MTPSDDCDHGEPSDPSAEFDRGFFGRGIRDLQRIGATIAPGPRVSPIERYTISSTNEPTVSPTRRKRACRSATQRTRTRGREPPDLRADTSILIERESDTRHHEYQLDREQNRNAADEQHVEDSGHDQHRQRRQDDRAEAANDSAGDLIRAGGVEFLGQDGGERESAEQRSAERDDHGNDDE